MPKGSFQVFTDKNTKVISPYGPSGGGSSGAGGSSNGGSKKVAVERVINRHGSSAGASSGDFHDYLGARKREKDRIGSMEQELQIEEERKAIVEKVLKNREEADQRTAKNRLKRQRMKERRKKGNKKQKSNNGEAVSGSESGDNSGSEGDEDEPGQQPTNTTESTDT